ncbi:contractile injection system tape measure protein [Flavivirga amylovorans]|uniref:Contractile injection system tape measure protein n=1 Tax=Flavivirga amylovorans TaxID=870486 RepID=A0ABT8X5R3_9FLAO|nr:contractile injection system tape measure protein [Flavivirga amylovorans]MDO5988900.1 contractile injection system tape measure protein [Flavivirga amylovorans]
MKEDQIHIIKSQHYEITLHDASQSYAYQSRISQLQEHSIQIILQKVMERYHEPGHLDQYDAIVLDLGTISASNFDRELGYKVEEAFIAFFKNNTYDNGSLIKGKRKPIYKTKLDQFVFFLKNGYMQWDTPSSTKPIELLTAALSTNRDEFISVLKEEGRKENIRKRLISQLQDTALEQIVMAIKDEEGAYINQSRRDIIQYQQNHTIVAVNKDYFRNAIWEIVLAYIFIDVTGYSNQKNFLKYLIHKIATKYNLTYKSLLKRIVSGIKKSDERLSSKPSLGSIVTSLLDEVEKRETASNLVSIEAADISFIETLNYYFKYNALPVNSTITTLSLFSNKIEDIIITNPTKFYTAFFKFIKEESNVNQFVERFSNSLINNIIANSKNEVLATITRFFEQMITISNKLSVRSATLNSLQPLFGKIVLQAYAVTHKTPTNAIQEFLYQIIKDHVIDQEFVLILKAFENEKEYKLYRDISSFIEGIKIDKNITNVKHDIVSTKFSKKLFMYYNDNTVIPLKEFQINLAAANYKEASYKLLIVLLDLYSKNKSSTKETIINWLTQRSVELESKTKDIALILFQMYQIAKILNIDEKIIEAIDETKISFLKKNKIAASAIEKEVTSVSYIPAKAYQELIDSIKVKLYVRSYKGLNISVNKIIKAFLKEYNIDENDLLKELKKNNIYERSSEFFKIIFERIISFNKQKTSNKNSNDDRYDLDNVQYFFAYGKLPWWGKDASTVSLQKSMQLVLSLYSERFVPWFKKSKHQKVIIDLMDDNIYNVFIKQVNASVAQSIIEIKQLFETLLDKDLSGIKNIRPEHYKTIQYLLLDYIQYNQQVEISKIVKSISRKLAQMLVVSKEDLYALLLNRIVYDKLIFKGKKEIESWLLTGVEHPVLEYKDLIQKIRVENSWKEAISFSDKKEIIEGLEAIYIKRPQELMFHLRNISFRKTLINQLSEKKGKKALIIFFSIADRPQLLTVFEMFKNLKKQMTTKNYQTVWSCFIDKLLLKIAINRRESWSINDWSLLLLESISTIGKPYILKELIPELSVYNNVTSEHIVHEIERLVAKKEKSIKEEEAKDVPEVIEKETIGESAFIENAGMIIMGPYIPMLFERMGLLENKAFKNDACQQKAVYVLQYAVTGKTEFEEHLLVLNKIICGMDIHTPMRSVIALKEEEKELIDGLLKAIIAHWSTIGNTSVEGLRSSFLYRRGRITIEEKKYVLIVEETSYDMLLDNIPWSIGQLKLSWMEKLVEIIWRA